MRPNPNTQWATLFVDALAESGLDAVCISPGSRSTPLTLAFSACESISVYSHIDERSAAYFALGMALATRKPVALLCTSGTAGANYYPAIIESNYAEVPILVLTADRPHELRESGANQSIDQVNLYGSHVRWFVDVAPPEADPSPRTLRYLRSLAARAMATANGSLSGAVHLNFPFRKPLESGTNTHSAPNLEGTIPRISQGKTLPTEAQVESLSDIITDNPHGLIFCGTRCPNGDFPSTIVALAKASGYPILADGTSGIRLGEHLTDAEDIVLGGYDGYLKELDILPQVILNFGGMPTSKTLLDFLSSTSPEHRILITGSGRWTDDGYRLTELLHADPEVTCNLLTARLKPKSISDWAIALSKQEKVYWQNLESILAEEAFEGGIVAEIVDAMPSGSTLYIANSLPVRHLDQFARPNSKAIRVLANRGTSGIDGVISSAAGASAGSDGPLVLIIGDLSFLHDLGGLLAVKRYSRKLIIVLINNDGGGIFHRLPVSEFEPPFTDLFITPHGMTFSAACEQFGIDYIHAENRRSLRELFTKSLSDDNPSVIEIQTDSAQSERRRKEHQTLIPATDGRQ